MHFNSHLSAHLGTTSILAFWLGFRADAMGYSLVTFYFILPVTTLILSFFIGKDVSWSDRNG